MLRRVVRGLPTPSSAWWRVPAALYLFPLLVVAVVAICVVGLAGSPAPVTLDVGFARGMERLTGGRLTVGRPELGGLLVIGLVLLRRARLDWLAVRPGPVEVRPLEDATRPLGTAGSGSGGRADVPVAGPARAVGEHRVAGTDRAAGLDRAAGEDHEVWLRRLSVEFREYLAGAHLYDTTTVPGDVETERIIEVFKGAQPSGRLAALAAAWTFVWPNRAFVVTATLRTRAQPAGYGVSVTVRRLPSPAVELESSWSTDFERALQLAAFAVTAYILPRTRACRKPPWTQWRDSPTPMPMELMRHYQRAKRMVAERRYDEALTLYHHALLYDADNVNLRYDLCQLFERLQLYPDALLHYVDLIERLFPIRSSPAGGPAPAETGMSTAGPLRRALRLGTHSLDDPFRVRYRYIAALSTAGRLAGELLEPEWPELRNWLARESEAAADGRATDAARGGLDRTARPWRAAELMDLRRQLAERFDPVWRDVLPAEAVLGGRDGGGLVDVLVRETRPRVPPGFLSHSGHDRWRAFTPRAARRRAVQQYFLLVAQAEAEMLSRDFRRYHRLPWRRSRSASLTSVVLALKQTLVAYRLLRFEHELQHPPEQDRAPTVAPGGPAQPWAPGLEQMREDLALTGYVESSGSWLEHYVVACFYALPLEADTLELDAHAPYAEAAVRALDRAQRCGDDAGFVMSKRYWLLAGDPDLSGLRQYRSFRAFESRVYLHPQPATRDTAKYELFHYLRRGLERGARQLERVWLQRCEQVRVGSLAPQTLEEWFREERRAWEICVRLGRYYWQWQTRSSALEGLRTLVRVYDGEAVPLPYPERIRDYSRIGLGRRSAAEERIEGMERIFDFLARELGAAVALGDDDVRPAGPAHPDPVLTNTRSWIWFAEHASRGEVPMPSVDVLMRLCVRRAAVWSALRQWATTPARRDSTAFAAATRRLEPRPRLPSDGRAPSWSRVRQVRGHGVGPRG